MIEPLKEGIYRILIPFEDIYTTSFVLTEGDEMAVLDSGNAAEDAENYLISALRSFGKALKYIVTSHSHKDHSGGRSTLMAEYPNAVCVDFFHDGDWKDGDLLFDRFQLWYMRGHSADGLALYDRKTKTLLTCDTLQQRGISRYRNGVTDREEYLRDIARIRAGDIETLIASHDYDPYSYCADGKEEIEKVLRCCEKTN